jgi:NAD(P)-dependent dehydrogenase (short-subunit alcohol dehydrogenase family)
MEISLTGRTALITGGSQGIGRAIGKRFAAAGGKVALVARGRDALEDAVAEIGANAAAFPCDITDTGQLAKLVPAITATLGPVDILINNAGSSKRGDFLEMTDEDWQSDLDLKLFGAIRLARLVMPGMIERKWGRIINVLNTAAKAPPASSAPTSVSRAAGMALTKVLAGEGAPHNILVNALLVGRIDSEQWAKRHRALNDGSSYESFLDGMAKQAKIPLGRIGEADEFARMALFLASDAGSYITGTAINVDGGMSPVV